MVVTLVALLMLISGVVVHGDFCCMLPHWFALPQLNTQTIACVILDIIFIYNTHLY